MGGCGSSPDDSKTARTRTTTAAADVVRTDHDAAVALTNAFRRQLRSLAVMTGAAGETGDIGQPVPTGYVDRASCSHGKGDARRTCTVRWTDLDGVRHSTGYRVTAKTSCVRAVASPELGDILDVTTGAPAINPLSELELGASTC